jgi:hypothetical protein
MSLMLDKDLRSLTLEERIAFSKTTDFPEPGVSELELKAIQVSLDYFGKLPIRILETGMCFGTTTRFFLTHILKYGGELHTVEFQIREPFEQKMNEMGLWNKIIVHNEDTRDMYWNPSHLIDFLFIDSEHAISDALGEYMRFRHFLNGNAIVGFHDSMCCWGVRRAIEMIHEIDVLEEVSSNRNVADAGVIMFKLIRKNRNEPGYRAK